MKLKPLTISDYTRLEPFFSNQQFTLCAYSLPSILVWGNERIHPCAAVQDSTLVLGYEIDDRGEHPFLILPVSPGKVYSPRELRDLLRTNGLEQYRFVPENYFSFFPRETVASVFDIEEEPEYNDYIYRQEDLAELKGNRYSKKRNLINQFKREYVETDRVAIEPITAANAAACLDFLEEWCEERDCGDNPAENLACEKLAAINAINHIETVGMSGVAITVDETVCAFGVASRLTDEMGVFHFEKAFARIKGLYQFLDQECAERLFADYIYINKESDMGIPGIAKAKASYFPVEVVKSFTLTLKTE